LTLVISLSAFCFADDPGQPDSVIIGLAAAEPGVPSIMLPVYVVTDDPVVSFTLPLEWISSDGQINLSSAFYFNTVLDWDEASDTLNMAISHLTLTGTSDTGGEPNPPLNTGYERELLALLRIVIHAGAEEQFLEVNPTFDPDFGSPTFGLDNGQDFQPYVAPGGLFYQSVAVDVAADLPEALALSQNYPNPFNMTTEIAFALSERGEILLDIYNVLGRRIRTLASGSFDAGFYTISWDGRDESGESLSSGMYFYSLRVGDKNLTKKMILLK
jgi:hypothetical protein